MDKREFFRLLFNKKKTSFTNNVFLLQDRVCHKKQDTCLRKEKERCSCHSVLIHIHRCEISIVEILIELNHMTANNIPSVMTAVQQNDYGEARDVLTLEKDVAVPRTLSANQILVRVHAASINPLDWKLLNGNLALIKRPSFPHVPGNDVAGIVVEVGSSVTRLKVGDKVYGYMDGDGGTYAEYICAIESQFALKPSNLTMIEAAAVPLACETSYQVLFKKSSPPIGPGSKIFVCGGATATGWCAIQLAKAVGAHVATTSSQRNFTFLEKLGSFSTGFLSSREKYSRL